MRRYHSPVKRVRSDDYQRWEYKRRAPVKVIRSAQSGARHIVNQPRRDLSPSPGHRVVKSRNDSSVLRFDKKPVKQPVVINNSRQEKPAFSQRQQTVKRQGDSMRRNEHRANSRPARQQGNTHRDGRVINR